MVRALVMQLRADGDPAHSGVWSRPANISLAMPCFTVAAQSYDIWSQRYLPADAAGPVDYRNVEQGPSKPLSLPRSTPRRAMSITAGATAIGE